MQIPKHIVVIIPTYNERDNIGHLLDRIEQAHAPRLRYSILVVDDFSPDGTANVVLGYVKKYRNIYLIQGKKQGIGAAYIRGYRYALKHLAPDVIVQIDADFSHDPQDIPMLLERVASPDHFVIGSRYINGGSIAKNWSWLRQLNSKIANLSARLIGGIKGVEDCTGGFRAISSHVLRKVDFKAITAKGHSFQLKLLALAIANGAVVEEVPIHFSERRSGQSKMRLYDIMEFGVNLLRIRWWQLTATTERWLRTGQLRDMAIITSMLGVAIILAEIVAMVFLGMVSLWTIGIVVFFLASVLITLQSLFSLWGMVYAWDHPERVEQNQSPKVFERPQYSFTALLPAYHEEAVIGETLQTIAAIDYPSALTEILVICRPDDEGTIRAARQAIAATKRDNIHLIIPQHIPKNKPEKLNIGLGYSTKDVVCVFDAEDSPHPDIYRVINTVMVNEDVDVVQSGVQLINFRSHWFSTLNVLEYYFWFKSVLHLFSSQHVIPLGGNTVFFKRSWLERVGGWDANCLTEDADIGITLSVAGARMRIIYDEVHATQEETPSTVSSFVKQRTRWLQGFLQSFKKGEWKKLPTLRQKLLVVYVLLWPEMQALMFLYIFLSLIMIFTVKLPIVLALISNVPQYILFLHLVLLSVGLYEFTKKYSLRYSWWMPLKILVTFLPFQILLGVSAIRALYREFTHQNAWEKTRHVNAHRLAKTARSSYVSTP